MISPRSTNFMAASAKRLSDWRISSGFAGASGRGGHQLSAYRGGHTGKARSRGLSCRHLARYYADLLAILDPSGRGSASAARDSPADRPRLGGNRAKLGAELRGGQGPLVQR